MNKIFYRQQVSEMIAPRYIERKCCIFLVRVILSTIHCDWTRPRGKRKNIRDFCVVISLAWLFLFLFIINMHFSEYYLLFWDNCFVSRIEHLSFLHLPYIFLCIFPTFSLQFSYIFHSSSFHFLCFFAFSLHFFCIFLKFSLHFSCIFPMFFIHLSFIFSTFSLRFPCVFSVSFLRFSLIFPASSLSLSVQKWWQRMR